MAVTRRAFLSGVSTIALAAVSPEFTEAAFQRSPANSNTIVNFGGGSAFSFPNAFLNIFKAFSPASTLTGWAGKFSGAGNYPTGTISSNISTYLPLDSAYYGRYLISWSGIGALGKIGPAPTIVYSGGGSVAGVSPSATGTTAGNMSISGADVNVEWAYGVLITAVGTSSGGDAGGAGLVKFTSPFAAGMATGYTVKLFNGISGFGIGPNSDGSWTITIIDSTHFSLVGSSAYAGLVAVTGSGGAGKQTEAIYSIPFDTPALNGTYSGFSNLVWCKKADLADVNAGKLVPQMMIDAFRGTRAAYLRFMDLIAVQYIINGSYANRTTPSSFGWGALSIVNNFYGGIATKSLDVYTCPTNPSSSPASGGYVDGEVVIAQLPASSGANTTTNPRMGITGRTGTAPLFNQTCSQLNMFLSGSAPVAGTVLTLIFTGGGLVSPFTYHYTTTAGDRSLQAIANSIRADLQGGTHSAPLMAAGIFCQNQTTAGAYAGFYYNPNINSRGAAQLGAGFSISGSDPTSALTFDFGFMFVGYMTDGALCSFKYSTLLGGWVTSAPTDGTGGCLGGPALEYYEELCTRCNSGMWYTVPILSSASDITSVVTHIANSGVKSLALEWGNETWNGFISLYSPVNAMASCLGISITSGGAGYSAYGLRVFQMAQLAVAAWTGAGRVRSDLKIVNAYQFVEPNGVASYESSYTYLFRFNGSDLDASGTGTNVALKAYGGLGVTSFSTNLSAAPNRPIDWCDWMSPAPYWAGQQYNSVLNGIYTGVPLSSYDRAFLAAYNYAYGNSAQKSAALDFLFDGTAGDLYDGFLNGSVFDNSDRIASWKIGGNAFAGAYYGAGAMAGAYDTSRSTTGTGGGAKTKLGVGCYEGGWFMGPQNSVQLTSSLIGYYTANYASGLPGAAALPGGVTDDAPTMAANLYNLLIAWKDDTRAQALVTKQFTEFKAAVNSVSARDAFPAWYGWQGPSIYGLYLGTTTQGAAWKAYDAISGYI